MHEFSRDILLSEIPDILSGTRVLDVGCGEGLVTRALAARGALATGVDPIARMIYHARLADTGNPLGVDYHVDDGAILSTVDNASVDWVTAALSLNNIPDLTDAVTAIKRVLRHEGHLVFTVLKAGFRIDSIGEPAPTPAVIQASPHRSGLPPFLLVHGVSR